MQGGCGAFKHPRSLVNPFSPQRLLPHLLTQLSAQSCASGTTISILDGHTAQLPAAEGTDELAQALASQA